MLAIWLLTRRRTRSGFPDNWSILRPGSSNSWKRLPPLPGGHFAAKTLWSGSTVWTTMALTARSTFTWGTCARRLRLILNTLPLSRRCMVSAISSGGWMMLSSLLRHLTMLWNSLRLRLILMFMLVVMVAVGTVALVASQATIHNLQTYAGTKDDQQIVLTLLTAYHQHQSQ